MTVSTTDASDAERYHRGAAKPLTTLLCGISLIEGVHDDTSAVFTDVGTGG